MIWSMPSQFSNKVGQMVNHHYALDGSNYKDMENIFYFWSFYYENALMDVHIDEFMRELIANYNIESYNSHLPYFEELKHATLDFEMMQTLVDSLEVLDSFQALKKEEIDSKRQRNLKINFLTEDIYDYVIHVKTINGKRFEHSLKTKDVEGAKNFLLKNYEVGDSYSYERVNDVYRLPSKRSFGFGVVGSIEKKIS